MKKLFTLQKIALFTYCAAVFASFIYSLYFMTDYYRLGLYELPRNQMIIDFHASLQNFNFLVFYISIFGAISILAYFVLQLNKKVADKLAMIVSSVASGIVVIGSIVSTVLIPGLISDYLHEDLFKYEYLEVTEGSEHVIKTLVINLGYPILIVLLLSAVFFAVSVILCHVKYLKLSKENEVVVKEIQEVGV